MKQRVLLASNGETREELNLENPGEDGELIIVFVARDKEIINLETVTRHDKRGTTANVWVRGVVMDAAEVRVSGVIKINKGADKTESFLRQNVLILSDRAKADVRPILEIEADDVKASHAATVGRADEEQLFYLKSRGLSDRESVRIFVEGYFHSIIEKIEDKLRRNEIEEQIRNLLN